MAGSRSLPCCLPPEPAPMSEKENSRDHNEQDVGYERPRCAKLHVVDLIRPLRLVHLAQLGFSGRRHRSFRPTEVGRPRRYTPSRLYASNEVRFNPAMYLSARNGALRSNDASMMLFEEKSRVTTAMKQT